MTLLLRAEARALDYFIGFTASMQNFDYMVQKEIETLLEYRSMAKKHSKDDKLDLIISEIGKLKSKIKVLAKSNEALTSAISKSAKEKASETTPKKSKSVSKPGPAQKSVPTLARKRPVLVKPATAHTVELRATSK